MITQAEFSLEYRTDSFLINVYQVIFHAMALTFVRDNHGISVSFKALPFLSAWSFEINLFIDHIYQESKQMYCKQ